MVTRASSAAPGLALVGGHQGVGEGVEDGVDRHAPLPGEDFDRLHHRVELHDSPSVTRLGGLLPPEHGVRGEHVFVIDNLALALGLDCERALACLGDDTPDRGLAALHGDLGDDLTANRLRVMAGYGEVFSPNPVR